MNFQKNSKAKTKNILSWFQDFFFQPIIKDQSNRWNNNPSMNENTKYGNITDNILFYLLRFKFSAVNEPICANDSRDLLNIKGSCAIFHYCTSRKTGMIPDILFILWSLLV